MSDPRQPSRSPDDVEAHVHEPALTRREREVLQFAAEGHTVREIAEQFRISRATVKTHLEHSYRKLDAHDRTSAVARALRHGIIR
jgi:DNA-binding NarL/FixJ family response regulator